MAKFSPGWRHHRRWRRTCQLDFAKAESAIQGWSARRNGGWIPCRVEGDENLLIEHGAQLTYALACLHPVDRQLIDLLFGLSSPAVPVNQIALCRGVSRQAVNQQKNRVLERLRTYFPIERSEP